MGDVFLNIREAQMVFRDMFYEKDSRRGLFKTFAWLVEEIGELGEALLKGSKKDIEEEIADVIAWTISIANLVNVDVEDALIEKYLKYRVES